MKKVNVPYLIIWAGIPAVVAVVLFIVAFVVYGEYRDVGGVMSVGSAVVGFVALGIIVAIPMFLESKMKKAAKAMEPGFKGQGFTYQYKFEANNAVYYIDQGGRMGVVYRCNPKELQFVDLKKVSGVRTNDGKFGTSTNRVSCEFLLDGKKVRITTLEVTRGSIAMKDKRVLEAISKADQLCAMLNTAKANAKA